MAPPFVDVEGELRARLSTVQPNCSTSPSPTCTTRPRGRVAAPVASRPDRRRPLPSRGPRCRALRRDRGLRARGGRSAAGHVAPPLRLVAVPGIGERVGGRLRRATRAPDRRPPRPLRAHGRGARIDIAEPEPGAIPSVDVPRWSAQGCRCADRRRRLRPACRCRPRPGRLRAHPATSCCTRSPPSKRPGRRRQGRPRLIGRSFADTVDVGVVETIVKLAHQLGSACSPRASRPVTRPSGSARPGSTSAAGYYFQRPHGLGYIDRLLLDLAEACQAFAVVRFTRIVDHRGSGPGDRGSGLIGPRADRAHAWVAGSGVVDQGRFTEPAMPYMSALYSAALRMTQPGRRRGPRAGNVPAYRGFGGFEEGTNLAGLALQDPHEHLHQLVLLEEAPARRGRARRPRGLLYLPPPRWHRGGRRGRTPESEVLDAMPDEVVKEALEALPEQFLMATACRRRRLLLQGDRRHHGCAHWHGDEPAASRKKAVAAKVVGVRS